MFIKLVKSFSKLWRFNRNNKPPKLRVLQTHQHNLQKQQISKNALNVVDKLQKAGFQAFLVGGCVRDLLLGIKPKDFDVATNATPDQIKRFVPRSRIIGRRFRLVHVHFGHEIIEVATFRTNNSSSKKSHTGRILRDNVYGTFEEDAIRRDFTINALYFDPFNGQIFDFVDGMHHLKRKQICVIGNSDERYQEDPVRMLRAIRFLAKLGHLGFTLENTATINIKAFYSHLVNIPASRLYDEFIKLFCSGYGFNTYTLFCVDFYRLRRLLLPHTKTFLPPEFDVSYTAKKVITQNNVEELKFLEIRASILKGALNLLDQKKASVELFFAALFLDVLEATIIGLPHLTTSQAIIEATDIVFKKNCPYFSVPRKIIMGVRDIWLTQDRLLNRRKRNAFKVIKHPSFKSSLQFFELVETAHYGHKKLTIWWQTFAQADELTQNSMLNTLNKKSLQKRTSNNYQKKKYKRPTKVNLHNIEHHA